MRAVLTCAMLLITLLPVGSHTFAQQQSREREALHRAQQQAFKLQQDNAALQREKADLEGKLKAAQAERDKLKAQAGRLRKSERALAAAEQESTELRGKLTASEEKLEDTSQKCQEQLAILRSELNDTQQAFTQHKRESQQDAAKLQAALQSESVRAANCEDKNRKLYSVTVDLIDKYKQNRGAWEKFLMSEPFTGLRAVEVENLLEDFREKAKDAQATAQ